MSRRDSTTWRYDFEPVDGGTRVRHSYEITLLPVRPIRALYGVLMPHHRDMRPHMRANLEALRDLFPGNAPRPDPERCHAMRICGPDGFPAATAALACACPCLLRRRGKPTAQARCHPRPAPWPDGPQHRRWPKEAGTCDASSLFSRRRPRSVASAASSARRRRRRAQSEERAELVPGRGDQRAPGTAPGVGQRGEHRAPQRRRDLSDSATGLTAEAALTEGEAVMRRAGHAGDRTVAAPSPAVVRHRAPRGGTPAGGDLRSGERRNVGGTGPADGICAPG